MSVMRIGVVVGLLLSAAACNGDGAVEDGTAPSPTVVVTDAPGSVPGVSDPTPQPTVAPTSPATTPPTATTTTTTAPPAPATTTTVAATTVPSTTTVPPPTTEAPSVDVKVYLLRGERLAIAHRQVEAPAVLRGALEAVLAGPMPDEEAAGLFTVIPAGTALRDVSLADGQAIVDLSRDFESGGGTLSMNARLAQMVFTATQFDNVDRVLFWLEGEPVQFFGGEGITIDEPWARSNVVRALTGGILVDSPRPGATVRSPFVVTGEGDLFEGDSALWVWRDGAVIAGPFLVQAGAWGTWDEFETTVTLDVPPGPIELVVDDGNGCTPGDPECGEPNPAIVPLTLAD